MNYLFNIFTMPRRSGRKKFIEKIFFDTYFNILWAKSGFEINQELLLCMENVQIILNFRYFGPRSIKIPKSRDWFQNVLPSYDNDRFKSCLRVTRSDFSVILEHLRNTTTFKKIKSNKALPIEMQLAVALYRFGCEGAGVSFYKVGQTFGISDCGMILNCTERVIQGILSFENEVIKWPDHLERVSITNWMEDRLPGCIGYLDGCHIPLFEAPIVDHESYFSRKQLYAIQIQAVCDNDLLFRDISIGYPASAHDARVFANSPIGQYPERFLSNGEWIAADSAYRLTQEILTPFRENSTYGTKAQRTSFNRHFSCYRVNIEHAFGILKKVFGSLRCLRIRVDNHDGHKRACQWILACCILYNIIKPVETLDQNDMDNDDEEEFTGQNCELGEVRRESLFIWINGI